MVTINSDDSPLFSTTLTDEYLQIAATFGFDQSQIEQLVINGIRASLLSEEGRHAMEQEFKQQFVLLSALALRN